MKRIHSFRLIKKDDLDIAKDLWKNEKVREYLGGTVDDSIIERTFERMISNENGNAYFVVLENEIKIGIVSIDEYYIEGKKELSYQFKPEYWGKGIASKTLTEILKYAKIEMKLNEIYAETQNRNDRSKKLLEKLNFSETGRINRYEEVQSIYKLVLN